MDTRLDQLLYHLTRNPEKRIDLRELNDIAEISDRLRERQNKKTPSVDDSSDTMDEDSDEGLTGIEIIRKDLMKGSAPQEGYDDHRYLLEEVERRIYQEYDDSNGWPSFREIYRDVY
ncbi:hypothetical protein TruAng_012346 [Truncatella angustata]|nr:hypothetical protein TruAng_012346 [Truncatella angustata]